MVAKQPFVWQMIKEAMNQIGDEATYSSIKNYIHSKYTDVKDITITCQIIVCTVNHSSRIYYPKNNKPRLANSQYDFLYAIGRGQVEKYDPDKHGIWEIKKDENGKLVVAPKESDNVASIENITHGGMNILLKATDDNLSRNNFQQPIINKPTHNKILKSSTVNVPRPCCSEVEKYLRQWDELENYSLQESALNKLFFNTYPNNIDIDDVLIKVSALNDFYSTHIFSPFTVSKHIISLNIDERLQIGDVMLVNDIARVVMDNGTEKNFYSFATKYCSHHLPLDFPIYDNHVDKLLRYFRDVDGFFYFINDDLRNYIDSKNILLEFREFYNLHLYNLKDIDKYLWQLGKEKFPMKYY